MAYIAVGMMARNRKNRSDNRRIDVMEKELESRRKPYVPSKWARDMGRAINQQTDSSGKYNPSGSFIAELDRKGGLPKVPDHAKQDLKQKGLKVK